LQSRIVRNYQEYYWDEDIFHSGKKKKPVSIVSLCRNESEHDDFMKAYAFGDWSKATAYLDGFNETVVTKL